MGECWKGNQDILNLTGCISGGELSQGSQLEGFCGHLIEPGLA